MLSTISRTFQFAAAHWLPGVPPGHKCANLHGHTYTVTVLLHGTVDPVTGWVRDFGDISFAWKPLEQLLDHRCLNGVSSEVARLTGVPEQPVILTVPTAENLALWLVQHLRPSLGEHLLAVRVNESPTTSAEVPA